MPAGSGGSLPDCGHWSENEVDAGAFKDARLGRRCGELLRCLSDRMGGTIPLACQDWASTKAVYRFFANPRVEEGEILSGHFEATKARYAASDGPILLLQDTTEFTYQRRNPHDVGFTKSVNSGRDANDRLRHHAVCGILMHSSLVVTEGGLPLGLAAVKFWNREKFRGTAQLKRKINPTWVPRLPTDRQAEALPVSRLDRHPCRGNRCTPRPQADLMEADHRSERAVLRRGYREDQLVCHEMEDRTLPQDTQIRLPGRRCETAHRRPPRQSRRPVLHCQLAGALDKHGRARPSRSRSNNGTDQHRNRHPRPARRRHRQSRRKTGHPSALSHEARASGRISRQSLRPTTRQHRRLARITPPRRHPTGDRNTPRSHLWVIARDTGGLLTRCWPSDWFGYVLSALRSAILRVRAFR